MSRSASKKLEKSSSLSMKERILKAATELFATQGFNGTSLQSIADAVGIQKPSLLYHYPSKGALREAVLEALLSHWGEVLPQVLLAGTSGENRVDAMLAEVLSFFRKDANRARLLMREILDAPDSMRARIVSHLAPWTSLVADYLKRGQSAGFVRKDLDPEVFIEIFVMMILGCFAAGPLAGSLLGADVRGSERGFNEMIRIAKSSMLLEELPSVENDQEE